MDAISVFVDKLRTVCENVGVLAPKLYCPFRFLDLPAEIRLLVYQELFGGSRAHRVFGWVQCVPTPPRGCEPFAEKKEQVHGQLFHFDHDDTSCRFQSALLRSCKTVYSEAIPVLYANPVFEISMFAGRAGNLPLVNAAHIRRITTRASEMATLNEHEIEEGYRLAGIQWDRLLLFAIDMARGLGSAIAKDRSADAIERAICGLATPIEYEASDVEWLYEASSASELRKLGTCLDPLAESWYVRNGSTVQRDWLPESPIYYSAHGSRSHPVKNRWATS